jgi:hypothetical protein
MKRDRRTEQARCEYCGSTFKREPRSYRLQTYCSSACANQANWDKRRGPERL